MSHEAKGLREGDKCLYPYGVIVADKIEDRLAQATVLKVFDNGRVALLRAGEKPGQAIFRDGKDCQPMGASA